MRARIGTLLLALLILVTFGLSLVRLFQYRFEAGDIYPPGSSRRADPLGSKALFEALGLLPSLRVERSYERIARLGDPKGTTLLLIGMAPEVAPAPMPTPEENVALDHFVRQGGRLVLAVEHQSLERATNVWRSGFRGLRASAAKPTNLFEKLTLRFGFELGLTNAAGVRADRLSSMDPVPPTLSWPGGWYLTGLRPEWHSVYERAGAVVAATRPYGSGQIVLLASDFLLLNGALRNAREPGFLSWLVGANSRVVFEETHMGLTLEPGVAGLLRKYHLGGAVLGLALLAGLHVWRHTLRFHPPAPPSRAAEVLVGRESRDGFLNILRRTVPPAQLSEVAFAEWRRSLGRRHPLPGQRLSEAQQLVNLEAARPPNQRNPVELHRQLAQLLRHR